MNWLSKISGKYPLRVVLFVPFVIQIFVVVGLIGYLSFTNGQKSVNEVTDELREEITSQIEHHLMTTLKTAQLINQINADAIKIQMLDINNPIIIERHFWQQLQLFNYIGYISFASEQGDYIGAEHRENLVAGEKDKFYLYTKDSEYLADNKGNRKKLTNTMKNYDPRNRNWYKRTVKSNKPVWSEIYAITNPNDLTTSITQTISANQPFYDATGTLKGVLGTDIYLSQLSNFLRGLRIGKTGKTFIMERSGLMVASSTSEKPYTINPKNNNEVLRLEAKNSKEPMIRHTTQYLTKYFTNLSNIYTNHQLEFKLKGERQFLQVKLFMGEYGIDWLIVVVIPQSDFMEHINANTRLTILLCLFALIVVFFTSLFTSKWLAAPILRLEIAAKKLAEGEWEQDLPCDRSDEIGKLAQSFEIMAIQLKELFANLEQKVAERTAQLKQKNELIRKIFGRYLSDEIVTTLLETKSGLALGGERREITILTSDIRGFTARSEQLPPEQVIQIINFYLAKMADVIAEYQGTIDEFMGDGILVLFGAPTVRIDDTERAVACAVAMQLAMDAVNTQIEDWGFSPLEMGIGINTGEVVVGNIGSEKRTKYGIIGKEVNLTYRIESHTIGGQIFISEATLTKVKELVQIDGKTTVQFKGVKQPITIYDVGGIKGKYDLFLSKEEQIFFALREPIPLSYTIVKGKNVSHQQFFANLIKLSAKNALLCCGNSTKLCLPEPMSNIKLNISIPNRLTATEDVYAKVLEINTETNGFYLRFTAIPPRIEAELSAIYNSFL
ncbi:adenylate/guanylate cyclase domain-containing protein [Thiotrichales bacterium HSG1]|nr:adenylate/guanylate cyclase domain-containing protein [Thiotrichales bacterium HSG1]